MNAIATVLLPIVFDVPWRQILMVKVALHSLFAELIQALLVIQIQVVVNAFIKVIDHQWRERLTLCVKNSALILRARRVGKVARVQLAALIRCLLNRLLRLRGCRHPHTEHHLMVLKHILRKTLKNPSVLESLDRRYPLLRVPCQALLDKVKEAITVSPDNLI